MNALMYKMYVCTTLWVFPEISVEAEYTLKTAIWMRDSVLPPQPGRRAFQGLLTRRRAQLP